MKILTRLYSHLPSPFQNILVSGYGYFWKQRRFGGVFKEQLRAFKERESYTRNQWIDYQTVQLRRVLLHAFDTVPYYNRLYSKFGFTRSQLDRFELGDLNKIPVLEKEDLRRFGTTDLISTRREKGGQFFTSSGSTGTPVKILFSTTMHQTWRAAFEARILQWAGVNHNSSRAMIGGRVVVPGGDQARPPFYRYNFFEKQIYFSIYHIKKENAWSYAAALNRHRPAFMTGYAASNFLLASYFDELQLNVPAMRAVITSSEKLTTTMRDLLSRVYRCQVFDSWSGIEACGLVSQHANGQLYSSPDVGILEILDDSMRPVSPGQVGTIYCTGLLNFDQPLIRYKIGDLMVPGDKSISGGPDMPVISEIVGRIDDVVTLRDGRQLSSFNRFFAEIDGIREVQVEQIAYDKFVLNLVAAPGYSAETEMSILMAFKTRLGDVDVTIRKVDSIPRNANGKFKAVVSHIKKSTLA